MRLYTVLNKIATILSSHTTSIASLNSKINHVVKNVSVNSSNTLLDLGLVTTGSQVFVFLRTAINFQGATSVYGMRIDTDGTFIIDTIVEGTHNNAPILDSNGVLKLKNSTTARNVWVWILS